MDKEKQIEATDWLTKGYSEEELARMKVEAIKEADAELRNKQIEEMAKVLKGMDRLDEARFGFYESYARSLYTAGYRKASEVAREIFEEIEKTLKDCLWFLENHPSNYPSMDRTKINAYKDNLQYIAELKKEYTESEDFIPAPPHTCQVEIPKYYESIINQVFPENEDTE